MSNLIDMADLIITIDGPAASGKSTVAAKLAEKLGAGFLDTGAMYRAVTFAAMQEGIDMSDENKLDNVLDKKRFKFAIKKNKMAVSIDDVDITAKLRQQDVTSNAHYIASSTKMRSRLVEMQRQLAADERKIVTEGRDQGTVAFPDANCKFYLTADAAERAKRRAKEEGLTSPADIERIQRDIEARDAGDSGRAVGPMKPADDAVTVDTTDLNIDAVVEKLFGLVGKRLEKKMPKMRWFRFARWLCKVFCMTFFKLRIHGIESVPEDGPLVLISNHQSLLDPMLCGIFLKRPLYFLARDSLFKGLFGRLITSVNTIPVKRGTADLAAMKVIIEKLREGWGVCLFPEATRSWDGKISAFKPGFGLLCRRGRADVVPVVIDGAFEAWPRDKKLFSPGKHIDICYGKCIPAEKVREMGDRKLADHLTKTLRKMQTECRTKKNKKPYDYDE